MRLTKNPHRTATIGAGVIFSACLRQNLIHYRLAMTTQMITKTTSKTTLNQWNLTLDESRVKHALLAHNLGFCVIQMQEGDKKPAMKYEHLYSGTRPGRAAIRKWFSTKPKRNIGVLLGEASDGIIAMDFDDCESYRSWAKKHHVLARNLPTARTRRGVHVYCKSQEGYCGSHDLRDRGLIGELKGNKTLTVFPGSAVDGHEYHWLIVPNTCIPTISLAESGLLPDSFISSIPELQPYVHGVALANLVSLSHDHSTALAKKRTDTTDTTEHYGTNTDSTPPLSTDYQKDILRIVESHGITSQGQRNITLWRLACDLKVHFGSNAIQIGPDAHDAWWDLYGTFCATPREVSETEFDGMLPRVDVSTSFLFKLSREFLDEPLPNWSQYFPSRRIQMMKLCRIIACADRIAEGSIFFLTMETMAKLSGYRSKDSIEAAIRALVSKKLRVLEITEHGNQRRANRYRLLLNEDGTRREIGS